MDLLQLFSQYGLAGLCVGYLIYDRITAQKTNNEILKNMNDSMIKVSEGMAEMSRTLNNINERLIIIETSMGIKGGVSNNEVQIR